MKIVLEGDYTITDATGQTTTAKPGDVVYFPKGSSITFSTKKGGLAFYVGQRKKNDFRVTKLGGSKISKGNSFLCSMHLSAIPKDI